MLGWEPFSRWLSRMLALPFSCLLHGRLASLHVCSSLSQATEDYSA